MEVVQEHLYPNVEREMFPLLLILSWKETFRYRHYYMYPSSERNYFITCK